MKPTRRLLAGVAAAVAISILAAACNTSPFAARINSVVIPQTALNTLLRQLAASPAYVADVASQSQGQLSVTGSSPGAYGSAWVDDVLAQMIAASAVHQYLAQRHELPDAAALAAARAVQALAYGAAWYQFPAAYRDADVQAAADENQVAPTSSNASQIRAAYQQHLAYFFTRVCTRQIAVSVDDAAGRVDLAASLARAEQLVHRYDVVGAAAVHTVPGISGGSLACYSQAQLESQPVAFIETVMALAPGHAAAPQRRPYGYAVVTVDSRQIQPFDAAVQRALSVAIAQATNQASGIETRLVRILARAHVQVNPQYGTWSPASAAGGPRIVPPLGSTAGGPSSASG
ncbi:MAG: hypothetical protein ACYC1D_03910 [Acidimicrobiales bacterium]